MDLLSRDYAIRDICSIMGVSRAGYYKWKKRPPSKRDINREKMIELVRTIHEKHRTHGYRWTAAYIRINEHIDISENYAYKCFRFLGIKSETRHQIHCKPRKVRDRYPNLIYSTWETVDRPPSGDRVGHDGIQDLLHVYRGDLLLRCLHKGDTDI